MPNSAMSRQEEFRWLPLEGNALFAGRNQDCDLWIDDPKVSRRHFRISKIQEGFVLNDLGSKNGTKVNGLSAKQMVLEDGDLITLGDTLLSYRTRDNLAPQLGGYNLRPGCPAFADESKCLNTTILIKRLL